MFTLSFWKWAKAMDEWSRDEFLTATNSNFSGLVYFYTPLCGTCHVASRMLGIITQMVDVKIGKMNLNFYPEIAKSFSIESVPCLMFVQNGEVKETIYAFHSVPYLLDTIKQYFY
jgi:thioredoxin-like negative regulator of GroEL